MSTNPETLSTDERFQQLERQVAEILTLLRTPKAQHHATEATEKPGSPLPEPTTPFVTRRSMLKQAALATLGAAAVLETMPSAKADDGSIMTVGDSNSATSITSLDASSSAGTLYVLNTSSGPGYAITGSSNNGIGVVGNGSGSPGVSGASDSSSGVYGNSFSGYGVKGYSGSNSGVYGRSTSGYGIAGHGEAKGGVYGYSTSMSGVTGVSMSTAGVSGTNAGTGATSIGVSGNGSYSGVYAFSEATYTNVSASGSGYGVVAQGGRYGGIFSGNLAPLMLEHNLSGVMNPNADTNAHQQGEIFVDSTGGLWYCVTAGTPGTWNRLAASAPTGSSAAGNFAVLAAPTRFIDTRQSSASYTGTGAPPAGSVGTFYYRFSGAGALIPYTPMGTTAPTIPFGATSLVGRMTVLSGENGHTASSGQLKVSNVSPPGFGSGLVVWGSTPATQIIPFVLPLNNTSVSGSGVIYFENTSGSDTIDLIVDVTGYYY